MTINAEKLASDLSKRIRRSREASGGFDEARKMRLQTMAANIKWNREHPDEHDEMEARGVGSVDTDEKPKKPESEEKPKKHAGPDSHPGTGSDQGAHAGGGNSSSSGSSSRSEQHDGPKSSQCNTEENPDDESKKFGKQAKAIMAQAADWFQNDNGPWKVKTKEDVEKIEGLTFTEGSNDARWRSETGIEVTAKFLRRKESFKKSVIAHEFGHAIGNVAFSKKHNKKSFEILEPFRKDKSKPLSATSEFENGFGVAGSHPSEMFADIYMHAVMVDNNWEKGGKYDKAIQYVKNLAGTLGLPTNKSRKRIDGNVGDKSKHMGPGSHPSGSDQQVHAGNSQELVDEDDQNLGRSLQDVEKQIIDKKNEHAFIFDSEGQLIFFKKGDHNSISFNQDEMKLMKDAIFTHNHPSGTDLSTADIYFAARQDMKEIRAVGTDEITGEKMEYRLERSDEGWIDSEMLRGILNNSVKQAEKRLWDDIKEGKISTDEASQRHSSVAIEEMFKHFEFMKLPASRLPKHHSRVIE
jgi:hypothetical protein